MTSAQIRGVRQSTEQGAVHVGHCDGARALQHGRVRGAVPDRAQGHCAAQARLPAQLDAGGAALAGHNTALWRFVTSSSCSNPHVFCVPDRAACLLQTSS